MPAKGVHRDASVPLTQEASKIVPPALSHGGPGSTHAILVGDGDVPERVALDTAWPGWADGCSLVVAADGGALKAARAGLHPDLVVGDGDSLGRVGRERLAAAGIPFELADEAKDESDLELAVAAAVTRSATRLTILGALGGPRFDHALANVWLLAHPLLAGRVVALLDATTRIRLLDATVAPAVLNLPGQPGDLVSLFPFGTDAVGVVTDGLRFALRDEPLRLGPARGLSNVRTTAEARVSLRAGRLLAIETHAGKEIRSG